MFQRTFRNAVVTRVSREFALLTKTGLIAASGAGLWLAQNEVCRSNSEFKAAKETTARALRLIGTVVFIVKDYEYAKFASKYLHLHKSETERQYWEDERDRRRECLLEAQVAYTSPKDMLLKQSSKTRKEIVSDQRDAVHNAAEQLAEAEEKITKTGDRKGQIHRKAALRLLSLCQTNGGTYIKIGQHLANLDYLIPNEYIEVLSSLFDSAPKSRFEDVCAVVMEDLGEHPDDLFDSFEREPIASASLAQVHVAYEKETGRKLAIKVQHRGLRETSKGDLLALTMVVHIVNRLFTDFTFAWIAEEIAPQLPKELDFCNEGKNAERASSYMKMTGMACIIPKIRWKQTSRRVLSMEFEEGFKATDLESIEKAGLKKTDIAKLISSVFNSQVFLSSFVHCDPHPANVLIRANRYGKPEVVLVDHGLYKEIDDSFRLRYASLWKSLMLADLKGIETSCKSLGVEEMYSLLAAILTSRPYDEIMERSKTGSLSANIQTDSKADRAMIQGYAQQFLSDIIAMLGTLPRQMLLLLKMNDCLRHIDFTLGSPTNTLVVAGKYASIAVLQDQIRNNPSWKSRFFAVVDFMRVMARIQIHDLGVWWFDRYQARKHYSTPNESNNY